MVQVLHRVSRVSNDVRSYISYACTVSSTGTDSSTGTNSSEISAAYIISSVFNAATSCKY
uniref:Uncharacterized protein n=1 Tax=Oryza punctata TaxID=4537 RepID=A0A0E0MML9_ORYPU